MYQRQLLHTTFLPSLLIIEDKRLLVVVFPFVPQMKIISFLICFDKYERISGHILSAIPPGVDEPFLPISLPRIIDAFETVIAKIRLKNILSP